MQTGDLWTVDVITKQSRRTSLGIKAREMLAISGNSVYFKDDDLNVYFVDVDWVTDSVPKLLQVFSASSVLYPHFENDIVANSISTWVSPYVLKVFPSLNQNSIDLV